MCRCLEEGGAVAVACGTRGEEGTCGDPPLCSREELGRVREQELRDAMHALGVTEINLLGYHDRKLAEAPADQIREQLVTLIRRYRPQVVMTFDPNGANLHPDHVAISRFTSDAVSAAGDARWYPQAGPAHRVQRLIWQSPTMIWDLSTTKDLPKQPGIDFLVNVSRWADRKSAALKAHKTQGKGITRLFFSGNTAKMLEYEAFRQAFGPPLGNVPLDDVFADLK